MKLGSCGDAILWCVHALLRVPVRRDSPLLDSQADGHSGPHYRPPGSPGDQRLHADSSGLPLSKPALACYRIPNFPGALLSTFLSTSHKRRSGLMGVSKYWGRRSLLTMSRRENVHFGGFTYRKHTKGHAQGRSVSGVGQEKERPHN